MAVQQITNTRGAVVEEKAVQEFKASLRGKTVGPDDEGYEEARRVWNGNIDRRPALIARCAGVADVINAVNFARANNLLVAVRCGGHNAAGLGTCDGGIVIDLSPMKGIRVDPATKTARAQGGVLWGELDRETQAFGLATTGGVISNTGIAGLTLGGGLGWLMGKHGLSCDNLLSADVVTADGKLLKASATENPDLFWGLRGGGGNFGIVTSFEFQLHPVEPMVLGGMVVHPLANGKDVLRFYRDFSSNIPDEAEAYAVLLTSPDGQPVVAMLLGYNGPIKAGERVLAPARKFGPPVADTVQPVPYIVRQSMLDPGLAPHGIHRYWKSGFTKNIGDALIDASVDAAKDFISPMTAIAFFGIHGAATRVPPDKTAFGLRDAQWDFGVVSQWAEATKSEQQIAWTRQRWGQMEPLVTAGVYVNHIAADDKPERVRASYGPNYDKLVALKNKYDPTNFFRVNQNIRPTARGR